MVTIMEQVNPEAVATTPSRRARLLAKSPKVLHHQRSVGHYGEEEEEEEEVCV
eukprot:14150.XXX_324209_324428_1 [CDS] Oithona nana genome sequencing.